MLDEVLTELGRVGYENLSFERIAEQCGVNKVTLYRRWPTRRDLTLAALRRIAARLDLDVDTGSLRRDLVSFLSSLATLLQTPSVRAVYRTMFAADGELRDLAISLIEEEEVQAAEIFRRALRRGEIAKGTDPQILQRIVIGTLVNDVVFWREAIDRRTIEHIADTVMLGAVPRGKSRR